MFRLLRTSVIMVGLLAASASAQAQQWVASWTGSVHGPYPIGNPTAQPELKFALPSPSRARATRPSA